MHFNSKLILTLLITLPSTFATINGKCTGRDGICISTNTCNKYGGKVFSKKCPHDPNNVKCCDDIPCKSDDGKKGTCMFANQCDGDSVSGKCPGGKDFKCCIPKPPVTKCTYQGLIGECKKVKECTDGFRVTGLCPGSANIQCCLPKNTCESNGIEGQCLPTNQCDTDNTVSGKCPGGKNIKCCLPKPTKCTYQGLDGVCKDVKDCNGFNVSGLCPGGSNIKCCLPKNPCKNDDIHGQCIPTNQCSTGITVTGKCPGGKDIKCCLPQTRCTYQGLEGVCKNVNDCAYGFNVSGLCPGGSDIKCCLPKNRCEGDDGKEGQCLPTSQCSTGNTVSGKCPGGKDIKCCLPEPVKCTYQGLDGVCKNVKDCDGFNVSGLCPGGSDNKCCLPKNTCESNGVEGQCIPTSQCNTGNIVSGLCPGGSDVKCCLPKEDGDTTNETKCSYQGLNGVCKNVKDCNGFNVSGLCPGGSDNKCCLPKNTCKSNGVEGQCIPTSQCNTGNIVSGLCPGGSDVKCCLPKEDGDTTNETKCSYQGLNGVCKNVKDCDGFNVSGLCPGGSDNKCCLPKNTCESNGVEGQCIPTSQCSTGNIVSGLCPGGSDVKCCLPKEDGDTTNETKCTYQGLNGVCKNVKDCDGFNVSGLCPGGSDNKCCLPKNPCESDDGIEGQCLPTNQCNTGNTISGKCPGGKDIKCCLPKEDGDTTNETKCTYQGLNGVCKNVSDCDGFNVPGLCPGGSDNKCCLPKNTCENKGVEGQCIPVDQCNTGNIVSGLCPGGSDVKCCLPPKQQDTTETKCSFERLNGVCKDVKDCDGFNIAGLCPGGSNIQCCLPKNTCEDDGIEGECLPVDQCSTGNVVSGKCPGGSGVKCCLSGKPDSSVTKCTYQGLTGICKNVNDCDGFNVSGLCPGGSDIKCCLPKYTCEDGGIDGQCLPVSQCKSNYTITGKCPGNNNIKCCLSEKPNIPETECKYEGLSGVCKHVNDCTDGFNISGLCPGGTDIKCCLPKSKCKYQGIDGQCLSIGNCSTGYIVSGLCPGGNGIKCCLSEKPKGDCDDPNQNKQNEKPIWDFLISKIKNQMGVAALMGNLYGESAINPHILEFGDGESYTMSVDSGNYTKEEFINDRNGYGIAQWTYPSRKEKLYNYAKELKTSIGDMDMQLEFIWKELNENSNYKSKVLPKLTNATSVREGSDAVLLYYENPAAEHQDEKSQKMRSCYGEYYYEKYSTCIYDHTTLASAAVAYAWETKDLGKSNDGTKLYRVIKDIVYPGDPFYQSCDRGIAVAVVWSGADDNFPGGETIDQDYYFQEHPELWKFVGTYDEHYSELQPGDIAITTYERRSEIRG
ncbi:hypothetical protein BCR32DRAFT_100678, partial [Anaeromyces robustus]